MKRKHITEIEECYDCDLLERKFNKKTVRYKCPVLGKSTKLPYNEYAVNTVTVSRDIYNWFNECPEWKEVK